jgi:protein-S-isoprenylcysteine O-methyltransferase Ste14
MSRTGAVLGSLTWLVLAPGTLTLYLPWVLTRGRVGPPLFDGAASRGLGALLMALGLPVLLDAFARFALQGRGTPVPLLPTERLVVTGFYRRVRNPMYVAVTALIVGEALLLGSPPVLLYGLVVWGVFHAFVVLYEEPAGRRRFGAEYARYCAAVPRWVPRLLPWSDTRG